MLDNYDTIASEPTHLDGAALGHVYLLKGFLHNKKIQCLVKNIYFSDHMLSGLKLTVNICQMTLILK